ncbi:hypothetical protein OB955_03245 [Halobacteria archaeon AArc-m2/3/4]|uniref:Uncharacterized protein n=1 Tax=Natronoglomus mannanivorans TaxID=2979990 RepID=A0AAP2YVK1_9EURY|nr:hypothetical protein [Halobacteria archaeon AArc-xg1-1]MCU4971753.1 hypothetical protein [Halobacteria archaeon AArc-m2/3/4]
MYSKHHAVISLAVGAAAVYALPAVTVFGVDVPPVALVAYATAIGVFVDLDHFLIARIKTGTWEAIGFCLRNPTVAFADQGRIFSAGDVGVLPRLLSHQLIVGAAVALFALESLPLAVLTAVVLYIHIVCDLCWDIWQLGHGREDQTAAERFETVL